MRTPYYRASRKCWYIVHRGRNVRLGKEKDEAFKRWHEIQAEDKPADVQTPVGDLIGEFLDWCEKHRAPKTYDWYRHFLISFLDSLGSMKLSAVQPHHVTRWLELRKYEGTTGNRAVACVMRCFNWAVKYGKLKENPVKGVERPEATPRESYITPEQWKTLLTTVREKDPFRDFIMILRETGCRPQEARAVEARHFDRDLSAWVFPRAESKGKKRQRVVPLNDTALAMTKRLALKYPEGPLFRNQRRLPWAKNSLNCRFRRLTAKLKFHVHAYALRHSFITDALVRGVEPMTLATIVGHASIDMIWSTYQKIRVKQDHIRQAVKLATGEVA